MFCLAALNRKTEAPGKLKTVSRNERQFANRQKEYLSDSLTVSIGMNCKKPDNEIEAVCTNLMKSIFNATRFYL